MKIEEANKIITEFMGDVFPDNCLGGVVKYYESLDALVPVWEKVNVCGLKVDHDAKRGTFQKRRWRFRVMVGADIRERSPAESIQQAACIATARAIRELEREGW